MDGYLPEGLWVLSRSAGENGTKQRVNVAGPCFTVGRHPSSNLCLSEATVSGRHAEVLTINQDLFVRDLNSTNGTLLNGRRLQNLTGLRSGDVLHFGSVMYTLLSSTDECMGSTVAADVSAEALAQVQFEKLLRRPALRPYFQPIIRLSDTARVGFEVLTRSYLLGLETPDKMFRVAATRNVEAQLSQVCRTEGLRIGESLGNTHFYLNTHPVELNGTELFKSLELLRDDYPEAQVVLEVHEGAVASSAVLQTVREVTRDLKMGLAYDDFGAGHSRLKELFEVPPDVLKFDVKFIHGLPFSSQQHRATIQSLIRIVRDLNVVPLAEGVETPEEAVVCQELGFELAQGYLFGRAETASHWTSN
jgi:EAL domain-containing protein (putative c-di-GMP-specific phosphodiesterase class I)